MCSHVTTVHVSKLRHFLICESTWHAHRSIFGADVFPRRRGMTGENATISLPFSLESAAVCTEPYTLRFEKNKVDISFSFSVFRTP